MSLTISGKDRRNIVEKRRRNSRELMIRFTKNECVAIGAHYDPVRMNPNAPGDDKIYNSHDDGLGDGRRPVNGGGVFERRDAAEAFGPFYMARRREKGLQ
ncbi:MAG: hypothetical protein IPJ30_23435 [Acidobacteria bacterium]|nr:hypothetical protein [Acidobacteriota bacterium]